MVRGTDGKERVVPVEMARTVGELRTRLTQLGGKGTALPLCHEAGRPERCFAVTRKITVRLQSEESAFSAPAGLEEIERPSYAPGHLILEAADPLEALERVQDVDQLAGVDFAEVQLARQQQPRALPNDPLIGNQWHLKTSSGAFPNTDINVESAWGYSSSGGVRGSGVVIGVVDDGLQTSHPDLSAHVDTANDKDWNGNDGNPNPGAGDDHGTACAGNVGAVGNNGVGVCGVAPESTLVGMRLIAASASDSQEAEAMSYLPDYIDILTNSWGPDDTGDLLEAPGTLTTSAFANAASTGRGGLGTIITWAGGNGGDIGDNSNYDGYANNIHTIAVGALDSHGNQAAYSEPGANLIVVAPSSGDGPTLGITTTDRTGTNGYNTVSSASGGDYTNDFGGTSSATPVVAGVAALVLEKNPGLGWRDMQEILMASADKCAPADEDWITNAAGFHFNHKFGAGLVDATAAVELAAGWANLPESIEQTSSQTGLSMAIPDNDPAGVVTSFSMTGPEVRCEHVTLTLSASHTYRGDLAITLTSPSGTVSRLSEQHDDDNADYSSWTFSTVRNWGESSAGVWTLRVVDSAADDTGTLTAATLRIYGTPVGNPPPVVAITSPSDGAWISPGTSLTVRAAASDLDPDGSPGTVVSVEFFDGGNPLGTDLTPPFEWTFPPSLGEHVITAFATDSEGETTTSDPVSILVINRPPVVTAGELSIIGQAFADDPVSVEGVMASDPEQEEIALNYDWQRSSDGSQWVSSGDTDELLEANESRAGHLWRCSITATDGNSVSAVWLTSEVNLLRRPPTTAARGESFLYDGGLVLRGGDAILSRRAMIHEFSQGTEDPEEWVEILMLKAGSLRGWSLSGGSENVLQFTDSPSWDSIPAGTLIVVYNAAAKDGSLGGDDFDPGDGVMVVGSDEVSLFSGSWPGFDNAGDVVRLSDDSDVEIFALSYGSGSSSGPHFASVSLGQAAYFLGGDEAEIESAYSWVVTSSGISRGLRVPALLPIYYGGSWSSLPTGFTSSGLTTYGSSLGGDVDPGSAKFGSTGSSLVIEYGAPAERVSFHLKGNSGGSSPTSGTFVLEESTDGVGFTTVSSFIDTPADEASHEESLLPSSRFVRFRYAAKTSGNIQLDKLAILEASAVPVLQISPSAFA